MTAQSLFISAVLFAALALPSVRAQADPAPDAKLPYKQVGTTTLHLHRFSPAEPAPNAPRACIVFFFGGGWNGGSPSQFYPHCAYLATRGMLAFAAEYRTKGSHGTTPFECVADGKSAVRWIRQHAAELGIDPRRIAAGGGSAGGHVAAATATLTAFDEPNEDLTVSARPDALVLFNPVFDNGPDGYGHDRVAARWREFSPLHNIAAGAPPTVVFLGTEDKLIPVATAQAYRDRMVAVGAPCEVWLYDGQPHGFFNHGKSENRYFNATLYEADRFLSTLGYVSPPPTLAPPTVTARQLVPTK